MIDPGQAWALYAIVLELFKEMLIWDHIKALLKSTSYFFLAMLVSFLWLVSCVFLQHLSQPHVITENVNYHGQYIHLSWYES